MVKVEMEKRLSDLEHLHLYTPQGASVYVLDTGALIGPEATAMLQALHSRSTGGFEEHLRVLNERGADNFMKTYYVGYNHKSIGDCGTTTVFVEGVSMLAAKAIQDFPLYNGQEASTRYINFAQQPFLQPKITREGSNILESQREFYLQSLEPIKNHLKQMHPIGKDENEAVYDKAINARVFDIARSFLPAGAATNLAWHSNLRQLSDRLLFLRHHPLEEIRGIAETIEEAVTKAHPHSFGHKRYDATEAYQELIARQYYYHQESMPEIPQLDVGNIDRSFLEAYRELFEARPPKTELPKFLGQAGTVTAEFPLDFGSFRDIHRHRAIIQRMPLLTMDIGFNSWYEESLPSEVKTKLPQHLASLEERTNTLNLSSEERQYYVPMGFNTANRFTGDLPATVYMIELRDSRFVHPTLQRVASHLGKELSRSLDIPLHVDPEPNRFDIKRGEQDIIRKDV